MYYKDPKKGIILVSLAGPLTNLLLALLSLIILKLNLFSNWIFESFIYILFLYNIVLAVFNLIPIPPLDGSKILIGLLPSRRTYVLQKLEAYGPIILIILAYLGILNTIMSPLITFVHAGLDTISNLVLFRF